MHNLLQVTIRASDLIGVCHFTAVSAKSTLIAAGRDGAAGSNRVFDSNGGPSGNRGPGSGNGNDNGNCKGNCAGNNLGNENGNRNTGTSKDAKGVV